MPLDLYLWFDKPSNGAKEIEGESQDKDLREKERVKPIKIKSFDLGVGNKTTIGSASGGASSGRCELKEFSISKATDSCAPDFFIGCATGGHYESATILLRKDNKNIIKYKFSLCFITEVAWKGSEGDDSPGEDIKFVYGALRVEYYPQLSDGKMKGQPKIAEWNQVNNSQTSVVTQH